MRRSAAVGVKSRWRPLPRGDRQVARRTFEAGVEARPLWKPPYGGLLVAVLLAGCAAMRGAPPVRTYRLAYQPPQPERSTPLPVTIRVVPFGIASAYDRAAFVYRAGPYDVGVDPYNEWISNPSSMLADLLARDLAASRLVQAVLQGPSALPADYELNGQIETFEERDEDGGCTAHVRVRVLLAQSPTRGTRRVVLQQSLAADEPCTRGDPESYVAAMSRAVQRLSDEIRAVIRASLESA